MLRPWQRPLARHRPGKVLLDLAVALAVGGDCLADIDQLRAAPEVFGPVASDPTVSRLIDTLAADAPAALAAIAAARAAARARAWELAEEHAPGHGADDSAPLVIDVDATLVTAHLEKECAAPTFKRGFGFHPLWSFVDHWQQGTGEPLAFLLRGQRRLQHRGGPQDGHRRRAGPAARRALPRPEGADPHRRRRRHARAADLADPPPAVLLGRLHLPGDLASI